MRATRFAFILAALFQAELITSKRFPTKFIPFNNSVRQPSTNLTVLTANDHDCLQNHRAYLLWTTEPLTILLPHQDANHPNFIRRHDNSRFPLQTTSDQAKTNHCKWASNGGPYNPDGSCTGTCMVDGHVQSGVFGAQDVGFGTTRNAHVFGSFEDAQEANEAGLVQFVTGFDFVVYDSKNVAAFDDLARAPRTAIGVNDRTGKLLLFVSDGYEHWFRNQGLRLHELADLLLEYNISYAINLDGGGSSVLVKDGTVFSRPTCIDIPWTCERKVSSVMCIKGTHDEEEEEVAQSNSDSLLPADGRLPLSDILKR